MSLREYRSKRQFSVTPEPPGARGKSGSAPLFVIQKHKARRLHYDLRLEVHGVLKSWAVPKGPSLDPEIKRLAVMVEDHPLEYGSFEGVIPKGNYGAGTVMVWDKGTYSLPGITDRAAIEDAVSGGLRKGRMHIVLDGSKVRGEFALFRMRDAESKDWLLRKIPDQYAHTGGFIEDDVSAQSARSLAEITTGSLKAVPKKRLDLRGIPRGEMPSRVKPMLAVPARAPFDRPGWLFEVKWDGYRAIAEVEKGAVRLYSRRSLSLATRFPAIANSLEGLGHDAVLDGEIVVVDDQGKSDFQLLQNYGSTRSGNLIYYVFDLLYLDGHDLTHLPLVRRKEILAKVIGHLSNIRLSDHIADSGRAFFALVAEKQLEGVLAKDGQSPYRKGLRSPSWLKIKTHRRQEAIIAGFTKPQGEREGFGSLILGAYEGPELVCIGHVGSGFSQSSLKSIHALLQDRIQKACPFEKRPETNGPAHWVTPELVCDVTFQSWTADGMLRHAVFVGLRDDVPAAEVRRNIDTGEAPELPPPPPVTDATSVRRPAGSYPDSARLTLDGHVLQLSNQNKIYFPGDGYTKHDMVEYYRQVSKFILPHLHDRPESLNRHPGGIEGKSFFQKDISTQKPPSWLPTVMLEDESKVTQAVLCQNEASLVYLANLGCIELNPWHSRVGSLDRPDYLVLDLDPEAIPFDRVVETALVIHRMLARLKVPGCCKTSGKRGLHIYVPLGARYTHDQAKQFGELFVIAVHRELPETTSLERNPRSRQKRVYLDFLQNGRGKTLAAAYCVRPIAGAQVSAPLKWSEVKPGLDPAAFTIRTMPDRLKKVGDLWQPVLGEGMDLQGTLSRMAALLGGKAKRASQ